MIKTDKVWWEKVIKNGIFAALFVTLLVYVIRTNDARETRYINMIDTLMVTWFRKQPYYDYIREHLIMIHTGCAAT